MFFIENKKQSLMQKCLAKRKRKVNQDTTITLLGGEDNATTSLKPLLKQGSSNLFDEPPFQKQQEIQQKIFCKFISPTYSQEKIFTLFTLQFFI